MQNYVAPVVTVKSNRSETILIEQLLGSSFPIGSKGVYISASHIFHGYQNNLENICILSGPPNKPNEVERASPIGSLVFAEPPSDVCMFISRNAVSHPFKVAENSPDVWQDVATFGYPLNIVEPINESKWINARFLKGYIQRVNFADEYGHVGANNFELSFLLGKGFSGSPLFVYRGNYDEVIGVCVGTRRIEVGEDTEEYGLAENLSSLLSWKPEGYGGLSILEISKI